MLNTQDNKPQEQGSTAKDFLKEEEFTDNGICYECGGQLTTKLDNVGFEENPKNELTIICTQCGYEPQS